MPPELDQVYDALRKADAAGNVEDARKLAQYIQSQRQSVASDDVGDRVAPGGLAGLVTGETGARPDVSRAESAIRGGTQGFTFGFGDEIIGGIAELGASGARLVGILGPNEGSYEEFRDQQREANRAAKEANPGTYLASEVVGGIASPIPLGKIRSIGTAARAGAVGGGIAGAGLSEADTLSGVAKDTAGSAVLGTVLPVVGGKIAQRLTKGVFPATKAGAAAARAIEKEGAILTPALSSESRTAKVLESLAESSILGSGRVARTREAAIEAAQRPVERFVAAIGKTSKEEAGEIVKEALEGKVEAFRAISERLYGRVDDAFDEAMQSRLRDSGTMIRAGENFTTEPTVSLLAVKKEAQRLLTEARQGIPGAELNKILTEILSKPNTVTFKGASRLRSDLLKVTRTGTEIIGGQSQGVAKRMSGLVGSALDKTAADAGPAVRRAYNQARQFYRAGAELFNSQMVKQLSRTEPESIVNAIARSRKPGTIRKLRKAIGSPEAWRQVQGSFLREMLETSFENTGDVSRGSFLSGKRIATKLQNFGDDALRELLGHQRLKTFRESVQVLEQAQRRTGSGLGGLNIRGGAELVSISTGNLALSALPGALAFAMTDPRFVRALTKGLRAPPGSRQAAQALSGISGLLSAEAVTQP